MATQHDTDAAQAIHQAAENIVGINFDELDNQAVRDKKIADLSRHGHSDDCGFSGRDSSCQQGRFEPCRKQCLSGREIYALM